MSVSRVEFRIFPGDSYYDSAIRVFRCLQRDLPNDKVLFVTLETRHQYDELRKKLAKRAAKKRK